jgi:hypothetical protein
MMELLIAIGFNLLVAALAALLIYFYRTRRHDVARLLVDPGAALEHFRDQFPDRVGSATLTADRRNALIDLPGAVGVGLLQGHGQRWNARLLQPGDVASVQVSGNSTLQLRFTDYGNPRAVLLITDADERALWLARLQNLTRSASKPARESLSHA